MRKIVSLFLTIALIMSVIVLPAAVSTSAATVTAYNFDSLSSLPSATNAVYTLNTNPENSHSGNNSVHFQSDSISWAVFGLPFDLRANAGKTFLVDFWYRVDSASGQDICFSPFTASNAGAWTGGAPNFGETFPNDSTNFRFITELSSHYVVPSYGTKGVWQHAAMLYVVSSATPSSRNYVWLNAYANGTAIIDAYIDDVTFTEVSASDVILTVKDTFEVEGNNDYSIVGTPGTAISYVPERDEHTFAGFYTSSSLTNEVTVFPSANTTVYTKWEVPEGKASISYFCEDGIYNGPKTQLLDEGSPITVPNPTHPMRDFAGWYYANGTKATTVTGVQKVTAKWTKTIGFESFYRSRANQLGYALDITDDEAYNGDKSAYFGYNADNWNSPVLTPEFVQPDDWATSYVNYAYYEDKAINYLFDESSAPEFEAGKYYLFTALSEEPEDFTENYADYGYFEDGEFTRNTEAVSFVSGTYYKARYADIDGIAAFAYVGNVYDGRNYEVTFKYKVENTNENTLKVNVFNYPIYSTTYPNAVRYEENGYTVPAAHKDGEWHTGTIYFTADAQIYNNMTSDSLGIYVNALNKGVPAGLYIDDVQINQLGAISYKLGDANGDGKVNVVDYVRLKRYFAGLTAELADGADANQDETVDTKDLTRLKKILLGDFEGQTIYIESDENILAGKKWSAVGDSLTDYSNGTASVRYYHYICEETGLVATKDGMYGVGGSGYINKGPGTGNEFYNRVSTVAEDSDVVTIFGSCNDFFKTLGSVTDTGTDTFCGCFNTAIANLKARCPSAKIGIISPAPVGSSASLVPWKEDNSNNGHKYVELMRQMCEMNGVAFLDIYHNSVLEPYNDEFNSVYISRGDKVHPNSYGNELIYNQMEQFIYSLFTE